MKAPEYSLDLSERNLTEKLNLYFSNIKQQTGRIFQGFFHRYEA